MLIAWTYYEHGMYSYTVFALLLLLLHCHQLKYDVTSPSPSNSFLSWCSHSDIRNSVVTFGEIVSFHHRCRRHNLRRKIFIICPSVPLTESPSQSHRHSLFPLPIYIHYLLELFVPWQRVYGVFKMKNAFARIVTDIILYLFSAQYSRDHFSLYFSAPVMATSRRKLEGEREIER